MPTPQLQLKGFQFNELFQAEGLLKLDETFLTYLKTESEFLYQELTAYREKKSKLSPKERSELLIDCAEILEIFLADLFNIAPEVAQAQAKVLSQDPIFLFKQWYVLREAKRRLTKHTEYDDFVTLDLRIEELLARFAITCEDDKELAVSNLGKSLLEDPATYANEIEILIIWCVQALCDPVGQLAVKDWVSFRLPQKTDYFNLVPIVPVPNDAIGRYEGPPENFRQRDGFKLTDHRMTLRGALNEIHYCVYCHKNEGDFCSTGFPVKKNEPQLGFKNNPLGETLTGCPLEEKISEMHTLKKNGFSLGSLAMVMVDNPMCPVTGHRICNDCMKGCIYQKQDPVNIPQTETRVLTDVLELPWGVEIYDLLTRWNPLRDEQWVMKPYNGLKVLIMGMGPAGFTLAHHLSMEGFAVVGTDGLKIEPLPARYISSPILYYDDIKEDLDSRIMAGFGGVAEYGITVRWDKNFLKLIYITLSRRPHFQVFGGVRFGGTLTVEDAWQLGFNHLAIAVGAGLPKELNIPGSLAPGMRQANDFLMALQLTGAAKKNSLANLQVRLPAVVIGGGLTGVDTATEVQAYYISQVEKTLDRYEKLISILGAARVRQQFTDHSFTVLNEFLAHGKRVRQERKDAQRENRRPDFIKLVREFGGVTIVYRRLLRESPAYLRNHEEITKAFEEGIYYAEGLDPVAARLDENGHVSALICRSKIYDENGNWKVSDEEHVIPARSIFVATGAKPNIAYEFEHRGTFHREGMQYQTYLEDNGDLQLIHPEGDCKTEQFGAFTSYESNGFRVSFLGDTHPIFHGSVVKAIASAKRTYPKIVESLSGQLQGGNSSAEYDEFAQRMHYLFQAKISKLTRLSPSVVEVEVHAPIATRNYQPGQFYRIQNFERFAPIVGDTRLQSEAVAMIGARVNKDEGTIAFMVLERGSSTRLFATFEEQQPISVMGPTGVRTKIPTENEVVMIIGGRMSAAHIQAVGPSLRSAGNKVLYVAAFKSADEVYSQEELEAAADSILWITEVGEPVTTHRSTDRAKTGDLIEILLSYAKTAVDHSPDGPEIPLQDVNRVIVIGSEGLVKLIQHARQGVLKNFFASDPVFIASIYGPMQCMLKGVCAQCLQWQIDPISGQRTKAVFSCSWQDQPLDIVDLDNLNERVEQNRTQEILTNLWLDYLFNHYNIKRI